MISWVKYTIIMLFQFIQLLGGLIGKENQISVFTSCILHAHFQRYSTSSENTSINIFHWRWCPFFYLVRLHLICLKVYSTILWIFRAVKQPFNQEMSQLFGNTTWNLALEELLKFTPNVSSFLRFAFYTITTMSLDKFGIPKFDLGIYMLFSIESFMYEVRYC